MRKIERIYDAVCYTAYGPVFFSGNLSQIEERFSGEKNVQKVVWYYGNKMVGKKEK